MGEEAMEIASLHFVGDEVAMRRRIHQPTPVPHGPGVRADSLSNDPSTECWNAYSMFWRNEGDTACTRCVVSSPLPRVTILGRRLCMSWSSDGGLHAVHGGGFGVHIVALGDGTHLRTVNLTPTVLPRCRRRQSHPAALPKIFACL